MLVVPLIVFGSLEAGLRIAGYGFDTCLFEKARLGGKDYLLNQESFSLRFFPPELSRWLSPLMVEAKKDAGTYRIFIFGESAAQGDPEPAFGAGRYLQALLRERYPGVNFEVVNVAITAINSHVILPIARECAEYKGDLWIVYMGNNEMIGPFGAATVFGAKAPPWPAVRLGLAIQKTRVGQWLMSVTRKWMGHSSAPAVWGGLQMFLGNELAPDDARKEVVYKNFQRNLADIVRAGRKSGAFVLLNTVSVNLKDCPPFASMHAQNIDPASREKCERLCAEGRAAASKDDWTQAATAFAAAAQLDPKWADAQFGQGQCLLQIHKDTEAAEHLQNACDDDALPFRADSRINGIIRQASREMADAGLVLCDAASSLPQPGAIPGRETFYEHVHFNFDGNYKLALLWAGQAARFFPDAIKSKEASAWASQQTCEKRLGLTDWNRRDVYNAVRQRMERSPLNSQFNNAQRIADLNSRINSLMHAGDTDAAANARALYLDAIARSPRDYELHQNYGEFLDLVGDVKLAALEWKQARELMPRNPYACLVEGQLLEKQGAAEPAREAFQAAVKLHPRYAEAWRELGKLDAYEGKLANAMTNYQRAAALQPNDAQTYVYEGKALSLMKRPSEALRSFRRAVELDAADWEAHYDLGGELGMAGQISEAKAEFENVIRLRPEFAMGHLNLGVALLKLKDNAGAERQFAETLRLDPSNKSAGAYLAAAKQSQSRP